MRTHTFSAHQAHAHIHTHRHTHVCSTSSTQSTKSDVHTDTDIRTYSNQHTPTSHTRASQRQRRSPTHTPSLLHSHVYTASTHGARPQCRDTRSQPLSGRAYQGYRCRRRFSQPAPRRDPPGPQSGCRSQWAALAHPPPQFPLPLQNSETAHETQGAEPLGCKRATNDTTK